MTAAYQPPGSGHWLGTDALGESVAERLVSATGETLIAVLAATVLAACLGTLVGCVLAFSGNGRLRAACEVLVGFAYAAPLLLVVLLLVAIYGDRAWVFPAIGLLSWGGIAVNAASSVERVRTSGFVRAALALGVPPAAAYLRHGVRHAWPTIRAAALALAAQLFQLSVLLAFLGVGRDGLGSLIREGYDVYPAVWWTWLPAMGVAALLLAATAWAAQRGSER